MFYSPEFAIATLYKAAASNNNTQLFSETIRRVQVVVCVGLGLGMISVDRCLYYLHYRLTNQGRLRKAALQEVDCH